jgi:hypothetical protein
MWTPYPVTALGRCAPLGSNTHGAKVQNAGSNMADTDSAVGSSRA